MRVLHIVARAGDEDSPLVRCLASLNPGDALLLLDGAPLTADMQIAVEALRVVVYALRADPAATGSQPQNGVKVIDFGGFVDLTAECDTSVSWGR